MKKLGLVCMLLLFAATQIFAQEGPVDLPEDFFFGAANPEALDVTVELIFFPWSYESAELKVQIAEIVERGRYPVVTMEPWWVLPPETPEEQVDLMHWIYQESLLGDISSGRYDDVIDDQCGVIAAFAPQKVMIRWGHEPDVFEAFPWSQLDGPAYIEAYRYFVTRCRNVAPNTVYLWSPAGETNLADFYPGDDVVDYVGLTILGYSEWDLQHRDYVATFNELLWSRYYLVRGFEKPVILAEFGVCCGDHVEKWMREAYYAMSSVEWYPLLRGVIYFNLTDRPDVWCPGCQPAWATTPDLYPPKAFERK